MKELIKSPLGLIKRAFYKTFVYPILYKKGNDYNATKYWNDRFSKYGDSFKSVGHEGLSEDENKKMYEEAKEVFNFFSQKENINYQSGSILEIGCGNGFFTQQIKNAGGKNYTGLDITDRLFPLLKRKFPDYKFILKDITNEILEEKYDIIVMIDVIEHIVNESKLCFAMNSIKNNLSDKGVLIIAPIMNESKKSLFYVRLWALNEIKSFFPDNMYAIGELVPFRNGSIVAIRSHSHKSK